MSVIVNDTKIPDIQPDNCPFCGSTAFIETFKVRKGYEANVHCNKCLANMPTMTFDTEEEAYYQAVADWNTRTTTTKEEMKNLEYRVGNEPSSVKS